MNNIAIGIDAQPRGLAITQLNIEDGKFVRVDWLELRLDIPTEQKIYSAYTAAQNYIKAVCPSLTTIELPMATVSSSSMALWGIYGAVCAAVYPYTTLVEGIVPSSWKKHSGLNAYAKLNGCAKKNGIIDKKAIPAAVIATIPNVPDNLNPVDLYDSIAIAKAGIVRNLERINK